MSFRLSDYIFWSITAFNGSKQTCYRECKRSFCGFALFAACLIVWPVMLMGWATDTSAQQTASRSLVYKEKRIALVIGNGGYKQSPLRNPVNDANEMALALSRMGFEVIKRIDADLREMKDAVRTFGDEIKNGGVGLFYFAGHGLQIDGQNYLVPIGASLQRKYDVEDQCLRANYVLGAMEEANNRINIIILDACRNNPFRRFRGAGGRLAKMSTPKGSILCYATAPGQVADDGPEANGLYTSMLLKHMNTPGLPIETVFKKVRADVSRASGGSQIPWESTSLTDDFFFVPAGSYPQAGQVPGPQAPTRVPDDALKLERDRWRIWQASMDQAWAQVEALDQSDGVSPGRKIDAWQRILKAFPYDNPFSDRDRNLRLMAQKRLAYWQKIESTRLVQQPKVGSWFVILGSYPHSDRIRAAKRVKNLEKAGIQAQMIDTNKYANLRDGLWAIVMGPYADKKEAEAVRLKCKKVVSDAYVKKGW